MKEKNIALSQIFAVISVRPDFPANFFGGDQLSPPSNSKASAESVEDAAQPFGLALGWLAPDRSRRHVVDEFALLLSQSIAALLAEARDLVPGGGAVDVAEVVRTVLLGSRCAHARVVARVVELPLLRVGQLPAVRRL